MMDAYRKATDSRVAERSKRRRRHQLVAALVAVAAAAANAAAAPADGGQDPPPGASVLARIPVSSPRDVKGGFGSIWVSNGPSRTVTRIDPTTGAVQSVVPVRDPASVLAIGADAVWLASVQGNSVTRIDPASNLATDTISLAPGGLGPIGITVFAGFVWIANHDGTPTGSIAKLDPGTMKIVDTIPIGSQPDAGPNFVAAGAGSLWTDVTNIHAVLRIDPASDEVIDTIPVKGGACGGLAANDTTVWAAGGCRPGITRIDPATDAIAGSLNAGGHIFPIVLDGQTLWYGSWKSNFLGRVDVTTDAIVGQLKLPAPPFGLTAAFGDVWVTLRDTNLLLKITPT